MATGQALDLESQLGTTKVIRVVENQRAAEDERVVDADCAVDQHNLRTTRVIELKQLEGSEARRIEAERIHRYGNGTGVVVRRGDSKSQRGERVVEDRSAALTGCAVRYFKNLSGDCISHRKDELAGIEVRVVIEFPFIKSIADPVEARFVDDVCGVSRIGNAELKFTLGAGPANASRNLLSGGQAANGIVVQPFDHGQGLTVRLAGGEHQSATCD
ncbi:MAG: hypothetical protein ACFB20_04180 [Opitutales bacterium]